MGIKGQWKMTDYSISSTDKTENSYRIYNQYFSQLQNQFQVELKGKH